MLYASNISVNINTKSILQGIGLHLSSYDMLAVLGANGSGKSTLLQALNNVIPFAGTVKLNGVDIKSMSIQQRAKNISVFRQHNYIHMLDGAWNVIDLVMQARYAHNDNNVYIAIKALEETGVSHLRDEKLSSLSGGQMQLVFLAKVFASQSPIIMLDEPTNNLDIKHAVNIYRILKQYCVKYNACAVCITHDLFFLKKYFNKALLIKKGKQIAFGDIDTVIIEKNLRKTYGVNVTGIISSTMRSWDSDY